MTEETAVVHKHKDFDFVVTCLQAGTNPMLIGPAGCGKTSVARHTSEVLGVDFYYTGAVESAFMLRGFRDAHGHVDETAFVKSYKRGGLFLFDEIDASDPNALVSIHAALDNGVFDTPAGIVHRHKDFYFLGAANTWGNGATLEYMGRNHLDGATLDRFVTIPMDYDEAFERRLVSQKFPKQQDWAEIVIAARAAARELSVRHIISTRAHLQGAALLEAGVDQDKVKKAVLWRGLPDDTTVKLEASVQKKLHPAPAPRPRPAPEPEVQPAPVPPVEEIPEPSVVPFNDTAPVTAGDLVIGKLIPGKGVFMGTWQPQDRSGKSLGQTYNVFAAPEDLDPADDTGKNCRTFKAAAEEVGKRRNWHGHDGIYCENDTALYNALKDGSAIGKWFIPTRDLLHGKDVDGNDVRDKHLYGLQNEGDFRGTFTTTDNSSSNYPNRYWSCTEHRDNSARVWYVRFSFGDDGWYNTDIDRRSCRPCRVELAL